MTTKTRGAASATVRFTHVQSPVGKLRVAWSDLGLVRVDTGRQLDTPPPPHWKRDDESQSPVLTQLRDYFSGARQGFDLRLDLDGTEFQRRVWAALADIPYGETTTYAKLARRVGRPGSARAVGAAVGRNPVSIILPCHRVVGSDGRLTGYAGGLKVKKKLLAIEGASEETAAR